MIYFRLNGFQVYLLAVYEVYIAQCLSTCSDKVHFPALLIGDSVKVHKLVYHLPCYVYKHYSADLPRDRFSKFPCQKRRRDQKHNMQC